MISNKQTFSAQIEDVYAKSIIKLQKKNYIANKSVLG